MPPEYELLLLFRASVPVPSWPTLPVPLIARSKSTLSGAVERQGSLIHNRPSRQDNPQPRPEPTCTVPAEIVKLVCMESVAATISVPAPCLVSEPELYELDANVTVFAPTSNAALVPVSRLEISWVLPAAQRRVEPPETRIAPVEPKPPLTNATVPALLVVPPV